MGKKCKKAKWLSGEALQIAVKRREAKSNGEKVLSIIKGKNEETWIELRDLYFHSKILHLWTPSFSQLAVQSHHRIWVKSILRKVSNTLFYEETEAKRGELVWVPGVIPCEEQSSEASLPCYWYMCQPDKGLGKQKQEYALSLGICRKSSVSYKLSDPPFLEMQKCLPIPNPHRLLPPLSLWLLRKFGQWAQAGSFWSEADAY